MKNKLHKLVAIKKSAIWGGKRLSNIFGEKEEISELWEYINTPQEANPLFFDKSFIKVSDIIKSSDMPIIVKIINAEDDLSLQVHPKKYETLIVLSADPNSKIVLGLNTFNPKIIREKIEANRINDYLKYFDVEQGDMFFIPSGLVHAIGKGIVAIEIQNAELTTYRLFDYNRKVNGAERALDVELALKSMRPIEVSKLITKNKNTINNEVEKIFSCEKFDIYKLQVIENSIYLQNPNMPVSIVCIEGSGTINEISVGFLDSFLSIPNQEKICIQTTRKITLIMSTYHSSNIEITST